MEQRKITVVSTRDHIRKTFMSSAKTLSELKSEMTTNGVDHEGLTFIEGLTKAEYKDDSSLLPATVNYEDPSTGEEKTTTELVFILTQPNKKIKSGATTRAEIYECIKRLHLEDEVKRVHGKNYTQVSTEALSELVDAHTQKAYTNPGRGNGQNAEEPTPPTEGQENNAGKSSIGLEAIQAQIDDIKEAMEKLVSLCSDIYDEDAGEITNILHRNDSSQHEEPQIQHIDTGVKSDFDDSMLNDIVNGSWL